MNRVKVNQVKQTAIFPGRYVQQEGALRDLGAEVERLGKKSLLIAGKTARRSIIPTHEAGWSERMETTRWLAATRRLSETSFDA